MIATPNFSLPQAGPVVFGDPRLHTDADVEALAFDADGSLWSVEESGVVRHWNATSGHQRGCFALSDLETLWGFSADGQWLGSASDDLSVWHVATGRLVGAVPQPSWVTALALGGNPFLVATGHDDGAIRCWDLHGQRRIHELRGHQRPVSALVLRADGKVLASAGEDKVIYLWDLETGRQIGMLTGHTDRVPALAFHPDGRWLVSAGWDNTARVWDAVTRRPVFLLNSHGAQVNSVAFSPDGKLLASSDGGEAVHVWQFGDFRARQVLRGDGQEIRCLTFSADGQRLASAGSGRAIHLWNPATGQRISEAAASSAGQTGIAVSPDGQRLLATGLGGIRSWDTQRGERLEEYAVEPPGGVALGAVAISPDGRWVAAGGEDARIRLWDLAAGTGPRLLEGPEEPVTSLSFSPDGQLLASASATAESVWLWSVATWEPALLIPDALDGCAVEAVAFHPQGRLLAAGGIDWLATGGSDGAVCLWDVGERCEVATLGGGTTCLAVHPSGHWLATASLARSVCVWDVDARKLIRELTGPEDTVTSVAYSPDGRWLACGSDDRCVRLWPVRAGQVDTQGLVEVPLDTQVKALTFSPDSRFLFTGNSNTTCYRLELAALVSGIRA